MGRSARLLAIGIAVAASACSVVSGWSDLQDGAKAGAGKGADGSMLDSGSSGDAPDDGMSGPGNVVCGAAKCPLGQGCCVDFNRAVQCTTRQACEADNSDFLACTGAGSCSGASPLCCYEIGMLGAHCAAGCGTTQEELCQPTDPTPCSPGKACTGATVPVKNCR